MASNNIEEKVPGGIIDWVTNITGAAKRSAGAQEATDAAYTGGLASFGTVNNLFATVIHFFANIGTAMKRLGEGMPLKDVAKSFVDDNQRLDQLQNDFQNDQDVALGHDVVTTAEFATVATGAVVGGGVGAFKGGSLGMAFGAAAGAGFFGIGAIPGAAIGGTIGMGVGALSGSVVGKGLYEAGAYAHSYISSFFNDAADPGTVDAPSPRQVPSPPTPAGPEVAMN